MLRGLATILLLAAVAALEAAPRDLSVVRDGVSLQASCGAQGGGAQLPKGQRVRLRFAIAGSDSRCFSVQTELNGKILRGYVAKKDLAGLEEIEDKRREASSTQIFSSAIDGIRISPPPVQPRSDTVLVSAADAPALIEASKAIDEGRPLEVDAILDRAGLRKDSREGAILRAKAFLQLTRATDALAALEPALAVHPDDPSLLALAGISSFQRDQAREALRYLKRSLEIQPNASVEQIYRKIEREQGADNSNRKTFGTRFTLRYKGEELPVEKARKLTAAFETEIHRVTQRLGCRFSDRVAVIVQTLESYRQATGSAEWSGGRYDGRIHIALPPSGDVDQYVRSAFAHEFTHACLARMGSWPGWLHEGLAQHFGGQKLRGDDRQILAELNHNKRLPSLSSLTGSWARMSTRQAAVAYSLSLAAAQVLYQDFQDHGVRSLLHSPNRLPSVEKKLDGRLEQTLR